MIWLSSDLRFKWIRCQLIWGSSELVVNWFELQVICSQLMCASNDFGCLLNWTSSEAVVNWFEIQAIWLSIGLRFKWVGCQLIWDSNELVVNWFEIQVNLVVNRCVIRLVLFVSWFEIQVSWLSLDLRFKWFGCQSVWDSKLFWETSFKIETLKLKNKAFLRDFLQKWSFEAQKRSFCARLPSKMKLWRSNTKLFCETSFKSEALKVKNEAFLKLWRSKTKLFCETSFKNETLKLKI